MSLQQHMLLQDLLSLSHFGSLVFYPHPGLSATPGHCLIPPPALRPSPELKRDPGARCWDYCAPPPGPVVPPAAAPDLLAPPAGNTTRREGHQSGPETECGPVVRRGL